MNTIASGPSPVHFAPSTTTKAAPPSLPSPLDVVELGKQGPTEPLIPRPSGSPPAPLGGGEVSWFHRFTGAGAGMVGGAILGGMVGGPAAAALGAAMGGVAGAMQAGRVHSSSEGTAGFHKFSAAVTGLVGGPLVGLEIGDLMYHAGNSLGGTSWIAGALIGAGVGVAIYVASHFFPDK